MKITKSPDGLVVVLDRRLDTINFETVEREIVAEIETAQRLEIDCSALEYISSAGLRALLTIQKAANGRGGSLKLTGVQDDVFYVLETTGFNEFLTIERA